MWWWQRYSDPSNPGVDPNLYSNAGSSISWSDGTTDYGNGPNILFYYVGGNLWFVLATHTYASAGAVAAEKLRLLSSR